MPQKFLARKKLRDNFIDIKNRINRAAPMLGGHFYTHDYLDGHNQWVDFYFLRGEKPYFWNATLATANYAVQEQAQELAINELEQKFGEGWFHYMRQPESTKLEALGGVTYLKWLDKRQKKLVEEGRITIYEQVSIDHSYAYGTGLDIVMDVDAITIERINQFILEFRQNGEREWCSETPINIQPNQILWGKGAVNALLEPWDWDTN